jgi:hypothetical protein
MARRRTLNYKELRAEHDAAERRKQEEDEAEEGDEEEAEDEEAEAGDEAEEGDEEEAEDEEVPVKKKKVVKEPKPKRPRAAKVVRQKVVWVVFDNSNRRIQAFEYAREKEAREYAAKMQAEKKSTYFVQPIKEPMEDK